jgi:GNAT superfamily N-acetyltransferase
VIRLAVEGDAGAVSFLLGELGHPMEAARVVEKLAAVRDSSLDRIWVAEFPPDALPDAGRALAGLLSFHAFPTLHTPGKLGRITALVVHPGLRGKGIGRQLVAVAERFARDCGCERLEVTSGAHRHDAHRFYASIGFSARPVRFTKDLDPPPGPIGVSAPSSAKPS